MNVIIMRGLPGSGKSTWVETQTDKIVCSADDYHMVDGEYRFDPKNSSKAHDACLRKYLKHLYEFHDQTIIVDNTNVTAAEIAPYARLASAFGVPFKIVYMMCDPMMAFTRNKHGVPISTILKMYKSLFLEEVPPYWPQVIV